MVFGTGDRTGQVLVPDVVGSLVGEREAGDGAGQVADQGDERPLVVAGWQADAGQVEGSFGVWVEAVDDGDALAFEGSCDIGNRGVVGNTSEL